MGGRKGDSNNFPASIFICAESFKDIALLKLFHVAVYSFPCDAEFRRNRFLRYVRIFLYEAEDVFLICSEFYCDVYSDIWQRDFQDFFIVSDMNITILEFIRFPKQQIAEELLKIFRIHINAFRDVRIIRAYKAVSEIPAVLVKRLIVYFESKRVEIFDSKNRDSPRVSLSKRVNLPNIGDELFPIHY